MTEPKKRGPKPKPSSEIRRNNLTFRIRDVMRDKLQAAAEKSGRSMSEVVEIAVEQYLDGPEFAAKIAALVAAKLSTP